MVLGTSVDFVVGRWGLGLAWRHATLRAWLEPRLAESKVFLARHGAWAILVAHFIGHVRSFVAITAGMSGLSYRRFLSYELLAALVWNLAWVTVGYLAGANLETLQRRVGTVSLVLVTLAVVAFVVYRRIAKRRSRRLPGT
jgi:membrane protein DedA with SNARE-associated domain